jgi:hypothetical protein
MMKTSIVALALILASPAAASSIPFDFTITGTSGIVTGVVVLSDPVGIQNSTDVRVTSNTAGWGIGEYVTVSGVLVDRFDYGSGHANGVFDAYLNGVELELNTIGDHPHGGLINVNGLCICGPTALVLDPAPVPGAIAGAGLPGLLAGFGGLVAWWRRRRPGYASVPSSQTTR